jgi:hypothetical protein
MLDGNGRFIDREQQLREIRDLLDALRLERPIKYPIREYTGIAGIGKTSLLRAICSECHPFGLPYIFVDIGAITGVNSFEWQWNLLRVLLDEMAKNISSATEPLAYSLLADLRKQLIDGANQPTPSQSPPASLVDKVLDVFTALTGVLLLDSLDQADQPNLEYLGQELVFPVSDTGRILIVLGSRLTTDWGGPKYKIWRRTKSTALELFTHVETREQVADAHLHELSKSIQAVTSGHPASNNIVVDIIRHLERIENRKISRETFGDYEARLVAAVVDRVIGKDVIIPENLKQAFRVLSVVRVFDVDLPTDILINIDPTQDWIETSLAMNLIGQMVKTGLVHFSRELNTYEMDSFVRKVLSLHMRFFYPEEYLNLSREAFRYYDRKLSKSGSDVHLIIEKLFHLADIVRMSQPEKYDLGIAIALRTQLDQDLRNCLTVPSQASSAEGAGRIYDAEERRRAFDRVKRLLQTDLELSEKIGDTEGFLLQSVDALQAELLSTNKAILDIVRNFSSDQSDSKSDEKYSVSWVLTGQNINKTVPINIPLRRKKKLIKDCEEAMTLEELREIGVMIRSHFLPTEIQKELKIHEGPLVISVNDTEIPWETIHDGDEFIALRFPMGKQLRTAEEAKTTRRRNEGGVRPLIIGVPETEVEDLGPLPHVEEEVITITEALKNVSGVEFNPAQDVLLGPDADSYEFLKRLGSGRYDIIHFAGHAVHDAEQGTGGLVLADEVVSLEHIKRSVEGRPVVFLNACHSGADQAMDVRRGYIGSYTFGVASSFVLGGALACIGSIWKVFDQSAALFAARFYTELMSGVMLGEALRRTKAQTRQQLPDERTWASYVLFGDPTTRMIGVNQR